MSKSYEGWSNNTGRGSLYYHKETGWCILKTSSRHWMLYQEDTTQQPDPTPSIIYRCPLQFPTVKMAVECFEKFYRNSVLVTVDRNNPFSQSWQAWPDINGDHILTPVDYCDE